MKLMGLLNLIEMKKISGFLKIGKKKNPKKSKKKKEQNSFDGMKMEKQLSVIHSADSVDPFVLRQQLTWIQWAKVVALSVTLVPVKLVLMLSTLLLAWALGTAALVDTPEKEVLGIVPLSGWRRLFAKPFIVNLVRLIFWFGGWRWTIKGRRASPHDAPLLLVGPHSSFLDTAAVIALGCPGMVVKDITADAPLFGSLIRFQQPVMVKSEVSNSRRQAAEEIRRRALSGQDWEQLLIFPEGGCGNREAFLHFKLGAFAPGVPVQPVIIRYYNELDSITWTWDGPGALRQLLLTLTQFQIKGELEFLPVYAPSEFERMNPRKFANNVQQYMSSNSDIPPSRFSVEDARFLKAARDLNLPPTAVIAKFLRLRKAIGRDDIDPAVELVRLTERSNNNKQVMQGDERTMAAFIGIDRCPEALKDFYAILDLHGKMQLDVRVYLACLCLIRTDLKAKEKLKAAFKVFGEVNEKDHLSAILLAWKGVSSLSSNGKSCIVLGKEESNNQCL